MQGGRTKTEPMRLPKWSRWNCEFRQNSEVNRTDYKKRELHEEAWRSAAKSPENIQLLIDHHMYVIKHIQGQGENHPK